MAVDMIARGLAMINVIPGGVYSKPEIDAMIAANEIVVVANFSALPDPSIAIDRFYWCEASQGSKYLPGSLGGTYYPSGLYYSSGSVWEYLETPYQATLNEVNNGVVTDKFVTPYTLRNSDLYTTVSGLTVTSSNNINLITGETYERIIGDNNLNISKLSITGGTLTGPLTGTTFIKSGGTSSEFLMADGSISTYQVDNSKLNYQFAGNGVVSGVTLSINVDNTKFNISSGLLYCIMNNSQHYIEFTGATGLIINDFSANASYIAYDHSTDTIIQQNIPYTPSQRRSYIILGAVIHSNHININVINNLPDIFPNILGQYNDLVDALKGMNVNGNEITPNPTQALKINKSSGIIFKRGVGFNINPNNPHEITLSSLTAPTNIRFRTQTGVETADTDIIDCGHYDVNGVRTVLTSGFQIMRIALFPSNLIRIQYGQTKYSSMSDALAGINTESFNVEQNILDNGLFRCALIVRNNADDLTNPNQAKFITLNKFGEISQSVGGVGGTTDLQQAYNNSLEPEITTNSVLGAVAFKRGSFNDIDNVIEILDGNNVIKSKITGEGKITATEFIATNGTEQEFLMADGSLSSISDYDNRYVNVSGDTMNGGLTINGNLNVYGNIIQTGSTYETHSNHIYTTGDTITLRDGAISGLANGQYAGLIANKYDGVNNGELVFGNDGFARVGDVGNTQKILTVEESPINDFILKYNSGTTRAESLDPLNLPISTATNIALNALQPKWSSQVVSSDVNPALPNVNYIFNCIDQPYTCYLPDVTLGNYDEFNIILNIATHNLTITTISGNDTIGVDSTSQMITSKLGSLTFKSDGISAYYITNDTRNMGDVYPVSDNLDLTDTGIENRAIYNCLPNNTGTIKITLPEPRTFPEHRSICTTIVLGQPGAVEITTLLGTTLVGNSAIQTIANVGDSITLFEYEGQYTITEDSRSKPKNVSIPSYSLVEFSNIIDPITGLFFRQRCVNINDPRFNRITYTDLTGQVPVPSTYPYVPIAASISDSGIINGQIIDGSLESVIYGSATASGITAYVVYSKIDENLVETEIARSNTVSLANPDLLPYTLYSNHGGFIMNENDRLIVRVWARRLSDNGEIPTITYRLEGPTPTTTMIMEVPVISISHNTFDGRNALNAHIDSSIYTKNSYSILGIISGDTQSAFNDSVQNKFISENNLLTGETANRIAGDINNYNLITGETVNRTVGDFNNYNLITGLTSTVTTNYDIINNLLTGETSDRIIGDVNNYNLITGETINRIYGDATNYNLITGETNNRIIGDSANYNLITGLTSTVNSNYNTLNNSITGETNNRIAGDANNYNLITGLTSTVTTNYNLLTGETANRIVGDVNNYNLITGLTSTVTTNYNTLNNLITGETVNRIAGDNVNYNLITGETVSRIIGDINNYNLITGETANRIAADNIINSFLTGLTGPSDVNISITDNTTNNATINKHGFLPKLSNESFDYLDGTGNWTAPSHGYAGLLAQPTFTENGDGTITIGSTECMLYSTTDFTGNVKRYTIPSSTVTPTNQAASVICANYNGGNPIYTIEVQGTVNWSNVSAISTIFRDDTYIDFLSWDDLGDGLPEKTFLRFLKTQRFAWESGLGISESATRVINIDSGKVWNGVVRNEINASVSNINKCKLWSHVGGVWSETDITQYNNTQYDNGTNLVTVADGHYVVNWIYRQLSTTDNETIVILNSSDCADEAEAIASQPPTVPTMVSTHCFLVGKIIVLKNASVASDIQSAFAITFTSSPVTNHASLSNLDYANSGHVGFLASNTAITGATKTKITYDSKGLVTSGVDATTADISDSSNKRYVTDTEKTNINYLTGVTSNIQTQLVSNYNLITGETNNRIISDATNYNLITGLTSTVTTNYNLLTGETNNRIVGDVNNYNLITGETTSRITSYNTLNNLITGETNNRIVGDVNNYNLITGLTSTVTANYNLLTGETANRISADSTKITANTAITGATKTKITYDSKGLVTSGADATTADIAASTNKNYVTDAQLTVIGNTSNTNSGDNAVNSLYSSLVSNATHTGDATGSTALRVVGINNVIMSTLGTGLVKNTTSTGVPSIASAGSDYVAPGSIIGDGLTMNTGKIVGRTTASAGALEEISVGSGLSLASGILTTTGSSSTFTTQDEGVNLSTTVNTLNFAGAGVTASGASNVTTITIPGTLPGDGDKSIQFNDGGSTFGGTSSLTYDKTTNTTTLGGTNPSLLLTSVSAEPAAASAGTLRLYSRTIANRVIPKVIGPAGIDVPLQYAFYGNNVAWWTPTTATTGLWIGTVGAGAGTYTTALPTTTSLYTAMKRARYANIVTTTNQVLGQRNTEAMFFPGSIAGQGGFFFYARMGFDVWTNGSRFFGGMHTATTVVSANPSASFNTVGFCVDSGDNGLIYFMTSNASTVTKATTGFTILTGKGYELFIFCAPNATSYGWKIVDINAGTEASGTATLTLPVNTTMLTAGVLASNAALTTVTATHLGINKIYVETDR